ncbi:MAG: tripartite tricarboxylate transporter TctB family protein [Rhodospirillaceae bacterium]|jgi:hypothetical protein
MPLYVGRALTALALMGISAYVWIVSEEFPANGHQVPQFTSGVAMLLCLVLLVNAFRSEDKSEKIKLDFSFEANKQYVILVVSIVYVPTIFELGFFTSSFLLLLIGSLIVGVRSPKPIVFTIGISIPLMYLFFEIFLQARLPRGILI